MKVIIKEDQHKVKIDQIGQEIAKHCVSRFEYGDYGNWVTALLTNVLIDKIIKHDNPKAISKYRVDIKSTWKSIDREGNISQNESTGYESQYVNDPHDVQVEIWGFAIKE